MCTEDVLESCLDLIRRDSRARETESVRGRGVLFWDGWVWVEEGSEGVEG